VSVNAFGRFLLERGALSREALIDALEYQRSCNRSLDRRAVELGFMTESGVAEAAGIRRRTGRRFEEIAAAESLLTREQLSALILVQMQGWVFLSDCLVRRGHLKRRQLEAWLLRWHAETAMADAGGVLVPAGMPNGDALTGAIEVYPGLVRQTTRLESVFLRLESLPPDAGGYDVLVTQRVLGEREMTFALGYPESVATRFAGAGESRTHALEAIAEVLNMLVGNVCAKLALATDQLRADPVLTFSGSEVVPWGRATFTAVFRTAAGPSYLACSFE